MSGRGSAPDRGRAAAVIVAAGSSTRMGGVKKEYRAFSVEGSETITVLAASVTAFAESGKVDLIVIVTPPEGEADARAALPSRLLSPAAVPPVKFVPGGATRRKSVHNALTAITGEGIDYVHIHDGARPWLSAELIERAADAVVRLKAVIPVMPLLETPKEIDAEGNITRHLRRASVVSAQTPQSFAYPEILSAHEKAALREEAERIEYTDDAEVWGAFVGSVHTIAGDARNKKITFPEDLPAPGAPA